MKLFNGQDIIWSAYQSGFKACEENKPGNPFKKETNEWYSWNKGWNSNYNL